MKPIILPLHSEHIDATLLGNKAFSLALVPEGFRTPGGFVITTAAYKEFVAMGIENTQEDLKTWLGTGRLPESYIQSIEDICKGYEGNILAARSSSNLEDGLAVSAAGIFRSEIGIPCKPRFLEQAIRQVWLSVLSNEANIFRVKFNAGKSISMAVLVQPMIQARISGVAFSKHPVLGEGVYIEATLGLGIPLVSGLVSPDKFHINDSGKIKSVLASKALAYVVTSKWRSNKAGDRVAWRRDGKDYEVSFLRYIAGGVAAVRLVDKQLRDQPALSEDQIAELYAACIKLEEAYGYPVDVEWAYDKAGLVILQARPARIAKIDGTRDLPTDSVNGQVIYGEILSVGSATGEVVGPSSGNYNGRILCVSELSPEDVSKLVSVRGVIVERGGILGHAAILCRELKIPCVQLKSAKNIFLGNIVTVDGNDGCVIVSSNRTLS